MTARPGQADQDPVSRGRQRADPQADLPHLQPRIAVQPVNTSYAVQTTGRDHPERTARHDLLGRLEDDPDPPVQLPVARHPGQHQRGTEQRGRV